MAGGNWSLVKIGQFDTNWSWLKILNLGKTPTTSQKGTSKGPKTVRSCEIAVLCGQIQISTTSNKAEHLFREDHEPLLKIQEIPCFTNNIQVVLLSNIASWNYTCNRCFRHTFCQLNDIELPAISSPKHLRLVVELTPLKNMLVKMGKNLPKFSGWKLQKWLSCHQPSWCQCCISIAKVPWIDAHQMPLLDLFGTSKIPQKPHLAMLVTPPRPTVLRRPLADPGRNVVSAGGLCVCLCWGG